MLEYLAWPRFELKRKTRKKSETNKRIKKSGVFWLGYAA